MRYEKMAWVKIRYKNPRVDQLLQQARIHVEQEERARVYEEACRLITEDAPDI